MISVWVMNFCRHRSIRFCTLLMSFQETLASSCALLALLGAAGGCAAAATPVPAAPPFPAPPALLLGLSFAAPAGGGCGCGGPACGMAPGSCAGATSMARVKIGAHTARRVWDAPVFVQPRCPFPPSHRQGRTGNAGSSPTCIFSHLLWLAYGFGAESYTLVRAPIAKQDII